MKDRRKTFAPAGGAHWRLPVFLGLAVSLLQLWFCFLASGHDSFARAYSSFGVWDGQWYEQIASFGYVSTIPPVKWRREIANVAFFPGFPIWTWIVSKVTSLSPSVAMVAAAQLMASVFWVVFFALMRRWTPSRLALAFATFLVFVHPAAFYLQVGYSESLFLAALLGFLYLTTQKSFFWPAAASAGIIVTSTRIVGAPLVLLSAMAPALDLFAVESRSEAKRAFVKSTVVSALSLTGVLAFFVYCWFQWGRWDLYMWTQEVGWNLRPNYLAILEWKTWANWSLQNWWPLKVQPNQLSQLFTSLYLVILTATAALEGLAWIKGAKGLRDRLPFYASAVVMMFISVSGLASVSFTSMVRYTFPVHVCWLIGFMGLYSSLNGRYRFLRYAFVTTGLFIGIYTLVVQARFLQLFTHFQWVA